MSIKLEIKGQLRIFSLVMLLFMFLIITNAKHAYALPLIMILNNTYQDNDGAGSIEGAYGMQIDENRNLAFISSTTDDYLTAINFSIPSNPTIFGSITDSDPIGSLDGIRFGTLDSTMNIFYAPSGTDSTSSWYNVTESTFVFLNDTAPDTGGAGSQQGEYDVVIVNSGTTRWLITGGLTDDIVSSFNVTNPKLRPAVVGSFTDSTTACSVGGVRSMHNIPGTNDVLVASTEDSYVTLLDISAAGVITCVGSGYTDTAGSGSIQGFSDFYYETSTGYLYVPGTTDGYFTILQNVDTGTPTLLGSVSGLVAPVSIAVSPTTFHGTKFAFVGSSTLGQGIRIINITNPASPTIYGLFNVTNSTCIYNQVYSLDVVDNFLYVTSGVDACFYAIELRADSLTNITLSFPYENYVNSTSQYVNLTFNATILDNDTLSNCSLWTNYSGTWSLNQTQSIGGISNITSFNLTNLNNKSFIWNIQCYDIYNNSGWASINRTVILNWTPKPPVIDSVTVDDGILPIGEIILSVGSIRFVNCTVTASHSESVSNILNASAIFYYYLNKSSDPDDNNVHYTNNSCNPIMNTSLSKTFLCGFNVLYYANNGTWYCNATVNNTYSLSASGNNSTIINPLYAINLTDGIDFGDVEANAISNEIIANVTNIGNMRLNISVFGYARVIGDNYAMNCSDNSNISISSTRYSATSTAFGSKTMLAGSFAHLGLTMIKPTSLTTVMNNTFWQIQPDPGSAGRECEGFVVFSAEAP